MKRRRPTRQIKSTNTLQVVPPKARNPLVAASLMRKAGSHRKTAKQERLAAKRQMRQNGSD